MKCHWSLKKISIFLILALCISIGIYIPNGNKAFASNQEQCDYAENMLDSKSKSLYGALKEEILDVTNGSQSTTVFEIPSSQLSADGVKTSWKSNEMGGVAFDSNNVFNLFINQFDLNKTITALMHDMPYELFWFDKTAGYLYTARISNTGNEITINSFILKMRVTNTYKSTNYDSDNPSVNTTKVSGEQTIRTNALSIVNKYQHLSDYQKLLAYKNEICDLVSYDHNATSQSYSAGYGNPWQLINVFDNNSLTNVVCEGYSKAFQYLCDLTTFNSDIRCYTITGVMSGATGAGNHMWNIVTMGDQKSYIVDITNCDEGSVGFSEKLFLTGTSGSIASGYNFYIGGNVNYTYDVESTSMWGTTSTSILKLSSSKYTETTAPTIQIDCDLLIYDGNIPSLGLDGSNCDIKYSFSTETWNEDAFDWIFEWYTDNNDQIGQKMEESPFNAGLYWVKVIATRKSDSLEVYSTLKFCIEPKELIITKAFGESRYFDNTNKIKVLSLLVSGSIDGDDVNVDLTTILAMVESQNIGEYNTVDLDHLSLIGISKNNYIISTNVDDVMCDTIVISKATPTHSKTYTKVEVSGTTLEDVNIQLEVKGLDLSTLAGYGCWINESGAPLDESTIVEKGVKYRYKFFTNDSNYDDIVVEIELWKDDQVIAKEEKTSLEKTIKIVNYALISLFALIVGTSAIKEINKKYKKTEDNQQ